MTPTLHVLTFKDGLLARLAHDLRLSVGRFEVALGEGRVRGSFDPTSARVDGVAHGERVDPGALSEKDKRSIAGTITGEILGAGPVELDGAVVVGASGRRVRGRLTLRGRADDVDLPVTELPGALVVDAELVPSRWGITPYRALAGAIRLQDRWRVRLVLPWEGGELGRGAREWRATPAR